MLWSDTTDASRSDFQVFLVVLAFDRDQMASVQDLVSDQIHRDV